jgi:hypothetical protein
MARITPFSSGCITLERSFATTCPWATAMMSILPKLAHRMAALNNPTIT